MKDKSNEYVIQSIDRATELLNAIARYPDPVSLKVLSAETGFHSSTTFRTLASLIHNRLVEKGSTGNYRLGLRLLQLGVRLHSNIGLRSLALPIMGELCDKLNESVNLTINKTERLKEECKNALVKRYALDNKEAEIGVGCIGVLVYDNSNAAVTGLSISSPLVRRQGNWIEDVIEAGNKLSKQLSY